MVIGKHNTCWHTRHWRIRNCNSQSHWVPSKCSVFCLCDWCRQRWWYASRQGKCIFNLDHIHICKVDYLFRKSRKQKKTKTAWTLVWRNMLLIVNMNLFKIISICNEIWLPCCNARKVSCFGLRNWKEMLAWDIIWTNPPLHINDLKYFQLKL